MRRGARDFIQKPWENERLLSILRRKLNSIAPCKKRAPRGRESFCSMLKGDLSSLQIAPSMTSVLETISSYCTFDANFSSPESMVRERSCRSYHSCALSPKRSSWVPVNTGGLADGVFESELFGHVKGAFTDARTDRIGRFELADGGTIFLDEMEMCLCSSKPSCCE